MELETQPPLAAEAPVDAAVIAGDALAFVIGGFNVERDRHGRGPNGKVATILGIRRASSPRADSGGAAAGT